MTPQQIVGLAVRLFAIWLTLTAVQTIGMAAIAGAQPGVQATAAPYVFAFIELLLALLLWLFPMSVAHRLVPRTQFENDLKPQAHELVAVACVALGLWAVVVEAVPTLSYFLSIAAFWLKNGQNLSDLEQAHHVGFLVGLIQLAVGLFLVLRAGWVARYVVRRWPAAS